MHSTLGPEISVAQSQAHFMQVTHFKAFTYFHNVLLITLLIANILGWIKVVGAKELAIINMTLLGVGTVSYIKYTTLIPWPDHCLAQRNVRIACYILFLAIACIFHTLGFLNYLTGSEVGKISTIALLGASAHYIYKQICY